MSSDKAVVKVKNLSKSFKLYKHPIDLLLEMILRKSRHNEHLVLNDLSFEVMPGEVVGILGRNGAGKSTLLKILSSVTTSSSGEVKVNGKVTAILELGTGFHDKYSGRENVYLGGMCLGLTRNEIDKKIDEIIEYSELEESIDNKFQTYSSGMKARLTFSTAAAVEPDILILDEALAVGDAKFQIKCFNRIRQLRENGKTVIFVSHNSDAITTFCDRALIIENGRIYAEGDPKEISKAYHQLLFGTQNTKSNNNLNENGIRENTTSVKYGDKRASIIDFGILDNNDIKTENLISGDRYILYLKLKIFEQLTNWSCGFLIKDARGTTLWGVTNLSQYTSYDVFQEGDVISCKVMLSMWLSDGDYFLTLGIAEDGDGKKIDFIDDAIHFRVTGPDGFFSTSVVNLDASYSIHKESTTI